MITETVIFAFLSLSLSSAFFWLFKDQLIFCLEWGATLLGSSFSGRSQMVQYVIFAVIILTAAYIFYFFLQKLSKSDKKLRESIVIITFVGILILLSILCFGQTLRRDDYWEIHDAQKYGFPGFLTYEFTKINGRYFAYFLRSMYVFFDPERYIHVALTVNILILFAASVYLSHIMLSLAGYKTSTFLTLTGGMIFALAALFMSPKIWEVWFWGSGTFVYGVGITLAITILSLYLDACRGNVHILLTILCITCACGTSELITASVCAFGAGLILINWIAGNKRRNKPLVFFTLWSFLCTGFILIFSANTVYVGKVSGGDAASSGFFRPLLLKFPELLKESLKMLADYFYSRLEYAIYLMIASFLFGTAFPQRKLNVRTILSGILWMVLISAGVLTMNIFMQYVPARVITIPLLWLFLPISVCFFLLGTKLNSGSENISAKVIPMGCSVFLLILVCVLYKDSVHLLHDIHEGWQYRDMILRSVEDKSQPHMTCTIPVIGSTNRDLSEDPSFETNIVTAYYYEFPQIIGVEPCPPFDKQ